MSHLIAKVVFQDLNFSWYLEFREKKGNSLGDKKINMSNYLIGRTCKGPNFVFKLQLDKTEITVRDTRS